jgi:hypothetical protein
MVRNAKDPASAADSSERAARPIESIRLQRRRRTEHLAVLSLAIVFALVGFALHIFWIASVVLLAVLWGIMASEMGSANRSSGMLSDVVTTVVDEARGLKEEISESLAEHSHSADGVGTDPSVSAVEPEADSGVTKKELYEEAREAEIEGRSSMTKAELQRALDQAEAS